MGVLVLTLDNTSGTPTHEFHIKLETSLLASALGLVYYAVHCDSVPVAEPYVISINIPWINTNTCILRASGHPTDCTNSYVKTQYALSELLISIDRSKKDTIHPSMDVDFQISTTKVPSHFKMKVSNGLDGLPYKKFKKIILMFAFKMYRLF